MAITLPAAAPPVGVPRSSASRAYGQATVLLRRGSGLVPAAAAAVTPYVAGTSTPYPGLLYAGPDATTPLVFPVPTGEDGVVALWSDAGARLELEATHPSWGANRVTLDLKWPPDRVDPDPDPFPQYATDAELAAALAAHTGAADPHAVYLTGAEGNAAYSPIGALTQAAADTRYVNTAGDTMTGSLDVRAGGASAGLWVGVAGGGTGGIVRIRNDAGADQWSLGIPGTAGGRDFRLYDVAGGRMPLGVSATTGDVTLSGALAVAGKAVTASPDASNALEWRANGFYAAAGSGGGGGITQAEADLRYLQLSGGSVLTGLLGPTTTNTRDLGTTALRWRKLWAVDGEFTNAPTVGGAALLTQATADALFLTPAEGNAAYATTAHHHDAAYVNTTGDTVSGPLTVTGDATLTGVFYAQSGYNQFGHATQTGVSVYLDSAAATGRSLQFRTGALPRWALVVEGTAETGSGAGSNLALNRYDDAGNSLGAFLSGTRATGAAVFSGALTAASYTAGATPAASGLLRLPNAQNIAWRNQANSADLTLGLDASNRLASSAPLATTGAAATTRSVFWQTGGLNRWSLLADATAEGGANAGSDFTISRHNDAGAQIGLPVTITRSTGAVTLANAVTMSSTVAIGGAITLTGQTSTTSATGGSATALPAQPQGYLTISINGTSRKVAYYAT